MDLPQIVFDIETGPLPLAELIKSMPEFEAPANLKDPVKIEAAIEEKQRSYFERAALSPLTGQVVAIGLIKKGIFSVIDCSVDEAAGLKQWWETCAEYFDTVASDLIGFNSNGFDLPFLIRRSYKHGVKVPQAIRRGRYFASNCVDLMELWSLGNREERISLDNISKFLGLGEKNGSGKDFAGLWATDRAKAIQYLENDLQLTKKLAIKLGVMPDDTEQDALLF